MHVRMNPIGAGRLIARYLDVVIRGAQRIVDDVIVGMKLVVRGAVVFSGIPGGIAPAVIEKRGQNEVAVDGDRRRRRGVGGGRNNQPMGVQIGRVEGEQGVVVDLLDRRWGQDGQVVDQSDLQIVARLQREPESAVGADGARIVRAGVSFGRTPAYRVKPARRDETPDREALDHAGLRNHQQVEHAVGACEDRRIDEIARTARRRYSHSHRQSHESDQQIFADWIGLFPHLCLQPMLFYMWLDITTPSRLILRVPCDTKATSHRVGARACEISAAFLIADGRKVPLQKSPADSGARGLGRPWPLCPDVSLLPAVRTGW